MNGAGANVDRSPANRMVHDLLDNPLFDCVPAGFALVFDTDLRYVGAGSQTLADLSLFRGDMEDQTIFDVHPPDLLDTLEPLYRKVLDGQQLTTDVIYHDAIFQLRLRPLRGDDGAVIAGMCFSHNVTQCRRREGPGHEPESPLPGSAPAGAVGLAILDREGRLEELNAALCEFLGYREDQLVGRCIADLTNPGDRAREEVARAELIAGIRTSYTLDQRYLTANGTTVWGSTFVTLVPGNDGTPRFNIEVANIVGRQRQQPESVFDRQRGQEVELVGRTGFWHLDVATGPLTWTAGVFALWGFAAETFDGAYDTATSIIHPDDLEAVNSAFFACADSGTPMTVRFRITRVNDGAVRWIHALGEAVWEGDHIVQAGGAVADITEQVQAELDAVAAASFQRAVFSASPDFITVYDFTSRSAMWTNRSITLSLGYSDEDVAHWANRDGGRRTSRVGAVLVHDEDRAAVEDALDAVYHAADDTVTHVEFRMHHQDGSLRWFGQSMAPLSRDDGGKVARMVGVSRDITQAKTSETALQESEARFRQLADNVDVGFVLRSWDPPAVGSRGAGLPHETVESGSDTRAAGLGRAPRKGCRNPRIIRRVRGDHESGPDTAGPATSTLH